MPARLRAIAERTTGVVRRRSARAARRVAGRLDPAPTGGLGALPPSEGDVRHFVASLLFPVADPDERAQILSRLPADRPVDASDVRHLLSAVDRMHTVSPAEIRPLRGDLRRAEVDGFSLWLDAADTSVSQTLLGGAGYEPSMTAVFRHFARPGSSVVDVGANVGYFTLLSASLVGPSGRVWAVEANSDNARLVLASVLDNGFTNVTLFPLAVAEGSGWAYFSTHVGSNGGLVSASLDALLEAPGRVVPTATIDALLADEHVDLLKMDVEGAEGRVLAGALDVVERCRPVVTSELSFEMLSRVSQMDPTEFVSLLTDRGYVGYVVGKQENPELRRFSDAAALVASWPDPLHLEDLLFVPQEREADAQALAGRAGTSA
jgi:FkbM family methyltransferase